MADALHGVRVVELGSGIPTAFAARLLGDLGAEVVKAEPPEGDPLRGAEPLLENGTSLLFEQCNWGKRSVVGDGAGLLAGADVVIAPPLPYITGFSTDYRRMAIATGERAAREALPRLRALLN